MSTETPYFAVSIGRLSSNHPLFFSGKTAQKHRTSPINYLDGFINNRKPPLITDNLSFQLKTVFTAFITDKIMPLKMNAEKNNGLFAELTDIYLNIRNLLAKLLHSVTKGGVILLTI